MASRHARQLAQSRDPMIGLTEKSRECLQGVVAAEFGDEFVKGRPIEVWFQTVRTRVRRRQNLRVIRRSGVTIGSVIVAHDQLLQLEPRG